LIKHFEQAVAGSATAGVPATAEMATVLPVTARPSAGAIIIFFIKLLPVLSRHLR
jgi:hypothetical protein